MDRHQRETDARDVHFIILSSLSRFCFGHQIHQIHQNRPRNLRNLQDQNFHANFEKSNNLNCTKSVYVSVSTVQSFYFATCYLYLLTFHDKKNLKLLCKLISSVRNLILICFFISTISCYNKTLVKKTKILFSTVAHNCHGKLKKIHNNKKKLQQHMFA